MRTIIVAAMLLLTTVAAVPAAEAIPVCVTHPCGPDPVGLVFSTAEKAVYRAEAAVCFVGGLAGLNCA